MFSSNSLFLKCPVYPNLLCFLHDLVSTEIAPSQPRDHRKNPWHLRVGGLMTSSSNLNSTVTIVVLKIRYCMSCIHVTPEGVECLRPSLPCLRCIDPP